MINDEQLHRQSVAQRLGPIVCGAAFLFLLYAATTVVNQFWTLNLFRKPVLSVQPSEIELGSVDANRKIQCSVSISNVGGGRLLLKDVKGSCDACIRIQSWPREGLESGQKAEISVEIDTGSTSGTNRKQLVIISNDWSGKPKPVKCSWTIDGRDFDE